MLLPPAPSPLRRFQQRQQQQQQPHGCKLPKASVAAIISLVMLVTWSLYTSNAWNSLFRLASTSVSCTTTTSSTTIQQQQRSIPISSGDNDEVDDDPFFINMTNYQGPARAFPIYPYPFPCILEPNVYPLLKNTPAAQGLLFQRPYKTGSTSMTSVIMRIARRKAQERVQQLLPMVTRATTKTTATTSIMPLPNTKNESLYLLSRVATNNNNTSKATSSFYCQFRSFHGSAVSYRYAERDRSRSFLMTLIRNPTRRIVSEFFHFGASVLRMQPTNSVFQEYIARNIKAHSMLAGAALDTLTDDAFGANATTNTTYLTRVVQSILDGYDFIAITERFDESLVAFKMLLNLTFSDILYTWHRSKGSFSYEVKRNSCIYIVPSFVTPGMKQFFRSESWNNHQIRGEILFYQAAWKSLDMTIDRLGRDDFVNQLTKFRQWNALAQATCAPREVATCDANGDLVPKANRTCIFWSAGCSDACLDQVVVHV